MAHPELSPQQRAWFEQAVSLIDVAPVECPDAGGLAPVTAAPTEAFSVAQGPYISTGRWALYQAPVPRMTA